MRSVVPRTLMTHAEPQISRSSRASVPGIPTTRSTTPSIVIVRVATQRAVSRQVHPQALNRGGGCLRPFNHAPGETSPRSRSTPFTTAR